MPYSYEGTELALFARALKWKAYFRSRISRYIGSRVLEVGAGIGGTTRVLFQEGVEQWTCLEPDPEMAAAIAGEIKAGSLPSACDVVNDSLPASALKESFYSSVLYIDVLEHIEQDREELGRAVRYLREGGFLIVLSPAHNWLFSPFDEALGHFRRYTAKSLKGCEPPGSRLVCLEYLDSVGLLASLANRLMLKQEAPTRGQIALWDSVMVPASRLIDPVLGRRFGKSILAVWEKTHP